VVLIRDFLNKFVWAILIGIGCFGMVALTVATPAGLGLGNDSVAYVSGARSLLEGTGYTRIWLTVRDPITHFPPFFSLALAFLGLSGIDLLSAARGLIILLYGLNAGFTGYVAWRITQNPMFGIFAGLMFLALHNIFQAHSFLMSEPLYLCLSFIFFLTFERYLQTGNQKFLLAAGILTGCAFLTRYVGLALLATGFVSLTLLYFFRREKLTNLGWFLGSSLLLSLPWLIRNSIQGGNLTNRRFYSHPLTYEKMQFGLENLTTLFFPGRAIELVMPYLPVVGLFFILAGCVLFAWMVFAGWRIFSQVKSTTTKPTSGMLLFILIVFYSFIYIILMLLSMSFYDAATIFEDRILAPVYITIILVLSALFAWIWHSRKFFPRLTLCLFAVGWLGLNGYNQFRKVESMRFDGQGFASRVWRDSKTINDIKDLLVRREIFTNKPTLVFILTDKASSMLPTPVDSATAQQRLEYQSDLMRVRQVVFDDKAAVVILGWEWMENDAGMTWYREVTRGLTPISQSSEGAIFIANP
jgi:4-amino-4-deoxy-L-arabinose transferase-like glycosyltransferase